MSKCLCKQLCFLLSALVCLLSAGQSMAATQSMTAHIAFDTPLALTKVADIDFGTVKMATADTYTIAPSGAVTAAGSGAHQYGSTTAGQITISGSATQAVDISTGNYVAQGGVTLQNATCSYNGSVAGPCAITSGAAPGVGKTLLVGVDAVVDGTQVAGYIAAPSFTVTVIYE